MKRFAGGFMERLKLSEIFAASLITLLCLSAAFCVFGCGADKADEPTAREVLRETVEDLLSLKSYRYKGTSEMIFSENPELNNEGTFDTLLVLNSDGALDGHMVVKAPGSSYETYTYNGIEYTKVEGGEWYKVTPKPGQEAKGMVTSTARTIIAGFADLVEDVRFTAESPDYYVVSLTMGKKYYEGAKKIAGAESSAPSGDGDEQAESGDDTNKKTVMTIYVDKDTMRIKKATMKDTSTATGLDGTITTKSKGTYSEFNKKFDIMPPPEALNAPEMEEAANPEEW